MATTLFIIVSNAFWFALVKAGCIFLSVNAPMAEKKILLSGWKL
jgi:hypothetical protein